MVEVSSSGDGLSSDGLTSDGLTSDDGVIVGERITKTERTYWIDGRDGLLPLPWWKIAPIALLAAGALIAASTLWAINHIENTLEDATRADLQAQGIDTSRLKIDYSYRDGTISGSAPEGVSADDLLGAVDDDGIRNLRVRSFDNFNPDAEPEDDTEEEAEEVVVETGPIDVAAMIDDDGMVVLTGTVLTGEQRTQIVNAAIARFGEDNVDNQIEVSRRAEALEGADDRVAFIAGILEDVPDDTFGMASVSDDGYAIEWDASNADGSLDFDSIGFPAPAGLDGTVDVINAVPPAENEASNLQVEINALEGEIRENVVFNTNSDVLQDSATETLDKVVDLMEQFPLPIVEISGHTDSDGDDAFNQNLSQLRAEAVVAYLVDQGVDPDRLTARGAGETEPIAENTTAEGRAENRRVELVAEAS